MIILSNTCKILSWIIFSIIIILIPIIFLLILIILISITIFINITCKPLQWLPIVSKARSSMQVSAKLIRTKFGNEAKTLEREICLPWNNSLISGDKTKYLPSWVAPLIISTHFIFVEHVLLILDFLEST